MNDPWPRVLAGIRERITPQHFENWIKPLRATWEGQGARLVLWVENQFFADFVKNRYAILLEEEATREAGREITLVFRVLPAAERPSPTPAPPSPPEPARVEEPEPVRDERPARNAATPAQLDANYTFDTFVVGACNQLVHAAARRVAEMPAASYNPLFIYGGVGLGKTHVMQAIGNHVLSVRPGMRVLYITSEKFMTQLINSIRYDRMHEFKETFRSVDMLLVDDIQFIAGKERTQEEFFHTFNALFEAKKQIVVSSDKFPNEIQDLEERLRSRFGWGLVADIQAPELETRIAILKKKAAKDNLLLPDDVAFFLANAISTNVRELEGALIRVEAYASLTGRPITLDLAKEALRDLVKGQDKSVTIESILKTVAGFYKVRPSDMRSDSRARQFSAPRQVAMFLCKRMTSFSYPEIGHQFGKRDHTTVLHAVRRIEERRAQDPILAEEIDTLTAMLQR